MWSKEQNAFVCSCHGSIFDPRNAAEVIGGPAPRSLAALGLKLKDGVVTVASTFSGHVGVTQSRSATEIATLTLQEYGGNIRRILRFCFLSAICLPAQSSASRPRSFL
jgi:hypothetical protein